MIKVIAVGLGGFVGAVSRYYLSSTAHKIFLKVFPGHNFPIGTFTVNIIGCFLLGFFGSMFLEHAHSESQKLMIIAGFLGAFTTFSTFGLETFSLFENKEYIHAFLNIFFSCLVGLAAVWVGKSLFGFIAG